MEQNAEPREQWRVMLAGSAASSLEWPEDGASAEDLPWRFEQSARTLGQLSHHALVLEAPGEGLLARIRQDLPEDTAAAVRDAEGRGQPYGALEDLEVEIAPYDPSLPGAALPFEPERFDLVLCSDRLLDAEDLARVMSPGAVLLMEQAAADDLQEISAPFGQADAGATADLQEMMHRLTQAGFLIERSEPFHSTYRFEDLESLLRVLQRAPWALPAGIDADRDAGALAELAEGFEAGAVSATLSRYLIQAVLPSAPDPGRVDFSQLVGDAPQVPKV